MIGGMLIQKKVYNRFDFLAVMLMTIGLIFFTLGDSESSPDFNATGVSRFLARWWKWTSQLEAKSKVDGHISKSTSQKFHRLRAVYFGSGSNNLWPIYLTIKYFKYFSDNFDCFLIDGRCGDWKCSRKSNETIWCNSSWSDFIFLLNRNNLSACRTDSFWQFCSSCKEIICNQLYWIRHYLTAK